MHPHDEPAAPWAQPPFTAAQRPQDLLDALGRRGYLADEGLATAAYLSVRMGKPLFLEGAPGTGKTELAKMLAAITGGRLIRLQCFEGIDVAQAAYEWDYARQLLHLRASETAGLVGGAVDSLETELYDQRFLLRRPLLAALDATEGPPPVLLIDEIDRADDEFEALLLEVLSDWAISIPEVGTVRATRPPLVVITSNRTRDVHDALKRRCIYHWLEHPTREREAAIIAARVPEAADEIVEQVAATVAAMRELGLYKPPGVSESIDWAVALTMMGCQSLDERNLAATLGAVVKYHEDRDRVLATLTLPIGP